MRRLTVLSGLGTALLLAAPLLNGANAAPLAATKVSASVVELAASKGPGRCGAYMFWDKKAHKCADARSKSGS